MIKLFFFFVCCRRKGGLTTKSFCRRLLFVNTCLFFQSVVVVGGLSFHCNDFTDARGMLETAFKIILNRKDPSFLAARTSKLSKCDTASTLVCM